MTNPIRDALAELVACKDLKDLTWRMKRDGKPQGEIDVHAREYAERKYKAWAAARAALSTPPAPSVPREPTPEMFDAALPNGNAWTAGTIWRAMYDAAINEGGQDADKIVQPGEGQARPEVAPVPPSPTDVRRFSCHTQEDGVYESRTGEHVAYADYAKLAAALRRERERSSAMAKELRDISIALQDPAENNVRTSVERVLALRERVERAEGEARLWLSEYNRLRQEIADATERCVAHLAERDALRADAERYRWLRAAQSQTARNWIVINNRNMYGEHELDAAIDAARKA